MSVQCGEQLGIWSQSQGFDFRAMHLIFSQRDIVFLTALGRDLGFESYRNKSSEFTFLLPAELHINDFVSK